MFGLIDLGRLQSVCSCLPWYQLYCPLPILCRGTLIRASQHPFITFKNKYLSNDVKIFGTCSIPLNNILKQPYYYELYCKYIVFTDPTTLTEVEIDVEADPDELRFNHLHGRNAIISTSGKTASRPNARGEFNDAIVMSSRPLRENELFEVTVDRMVDRWSGSIEAGKWK